MILPSQRRHGIFDIAGKNIMQENPFYNTFNQFIILSYLVLGLVEIITGIILSRLWSVILGISFLLMGVLWVASLIVRYRKGRR